MSPFWQNAVALSVVAVAFGYVGYSAYRWLFAKSTAGCSKGCGGCSTEKPLVSLELAPPSTRKSSS